MTTPDDLLAAAGFRNIVRDLGRRADGVLPLETLLMALMFRALYPLLRRYGVAVRQKNRLIDLW